MWLLIPFVLVPMLEIALFIQVGGWLGLWPTLGLVLLTAVAGTILMRQQGLQTLGKLQAALDQGGDPVTPMAHGAMILVAGVLLLTPGFFTDALGLGLLVPGLRTVLIRWGAAHLAVRHVRFGQRPAGPRTGADAPIDADYEVVDPPQTTGRDDAPRGGSGWTQPPADRDPRN